VLANIAESEELWFHIDGAYGALAMLSPELAPRLAGIERADSIAFDFPAACLRHETRGLAAGPRIAQYRLRPIPRRPRR